MWWVRLVGPRLISLDLKFFFLQTWGGGSDSYFEYLIKYQRLNNTADPIYVESWSTAVDSSIKTLLKVLLSQKLFDPALNLRIIDSFSQQLEISCGL